MSFEATEIIPIREGTLTIRGVDWAGMPIIFETKINNRFGASDSLVVKTSQEDTIFSTGEGDQHLVKGSRQYTLEIDCAIPVPNDWTTPYLLENTE